MRVLNLTFSAFGPYKEKQTLDFTQLGSESIFLITGPTGAGKTTIFDAICYALYGKASGADRDHDTLRSDFSTNEQMTEVTLTFELKQSTYLIRRKPKQLRPKARGEGMIEEPATANLYQIINKTDKLLTSKIKDVNETISELLGLDYDQFLKMIMIPQGEFRKLISENSHEREKILQKIFRTHIYQNITNTLKQQTKEMHTQLKTVNSQITDQLEAIDWEHSREEVENWSVDHAIEQMQILIGQMKENYSQENKRFEKYKETYTLAQKNIREKEQLANDFKRFERLKEDKKHLIQQEESIDRFKNTLATAEKAIQIEGYENQFKLRIKEANEEKAKLDHLKAELDLEQQQLKVVETAYNQLKEDYKEKEEQQQQHIQVKKQAEIWTKVINLEKNIKQAQQNQQILTKKITEEEKELKRITIEIESINQALEQQLDLSEQSLKLKHRKVESEQQLIQVTKLEKNYLDYCQLSEDYQQFETSYQKLDQKLTEAKTRLQTFEANQQQHVAGHLANQLESDQPCPVCGALEHPNPAILPKETGEDNDHEALKERVHLLEDEQKQVQDQLIEIKSKYGSKKSLLTDFASEFDQQIDHISKEWLEKQFKLTQNVASKVLKEIELNDQELAKLSNQKDSKQELTDQLKKSESELDTLKLEHKQSDQILSALLGEKKSYVSELPVTDLNFDEWIEKHKLEKEKLEAWFKDYETTEKQFEQLNVAVTKLATRFEAQEQFAKQLIKNSEEAERIFYEQLKQAGFIDKPSYLAAKRSSNELQEIKRTIEDFQEQWTQVTHQIEQYQNKLADQKQPNLEELEKQLNKMQDDYDRMIRKVEQLKEMHTKHQLIFDKVTHLNNHYKKTDKTFRDLSALAEMANGDNHLKLSFERYVLSAFLEQIVLQANLRFSNLTDHRYELIISNQLAKHGAKSGLDLEVYDQHTGKNRSVKTLSGGEGFKASLSLALGMADVVQAHAGGVQLDTLFLDEGFGTLDEVSLEQAVDTLKGLQQSNRVLGIISHVNQLKEEIHAKLEVKSTPQGSTAKFNL